MLDVYIVDSYGYHNENLRYIFDGENWLNIVNMVLPHKFTPFDRICFVFCDVAVPFKDYELVKYGTSLYEKTYSIDSYKNKYWTAIFSFKLDVDMVLQISIHYYKNRYKKFVCGNAYNLIEILYKYENLHAKPYSESILDIVKIDLPTDLAKIVRDYLVYGCCEWVENLHNSPSYLKKIVGIL